MSPSGSAFLYDLDALRAWARRLRQALGSVELFYACKANPLSHVLRVLEAEGYGFDIASEGELLQASRHAPRSPRICTGPAKSASFFAAALAKGVRLFVLESARQLELLERSCAERGVEVEALLRLQLEWDEGESVLGGSAVSAFGLTPGAWTEALRTEVAPHVRIRGVHIFQWGNETELPRLKAVWEKVRESALAFSEESGCPLEILDLGGGLGLPYEGGEILAPEQVGEALESLRRRLPRTRLLLELGRYLVGPCGTYSTPIVDRKEVRGEDFLLTEGGAQHLVRPALVGQSFPARLTRESSAPLRRFRVHGPLCTALDRLGSYELPGDCAPGDRLELSLAGAYGFTESMPFFLCHEGAAELIRVNGEIRVAREPLKPEEWLR